MRRKGQNLRSSSSEGEALRGDNSIAVPDVRRMNRILREHNVGYEIRPPELVPL